MNATTKPALLAFLATCACTPAPPKTLTLATTTSTERSGLLAAIHPTFEESTGIRIKVVAKGTGAALRLAREGNADVVLVHAPAEEERFVEEGWGLARHPVMVNDFVLVGPTADPALVQGSPDVATAFARIATAWQTFVSRGDASGTHVKEHEIWKGTGLPLVPCPSVSDGALEMPSGTWYHSIGSGMGETLVYTTEKQGYTLADRGTFDAFSLDDPPRTDLVVVHEGDALLLNPYSVIPVNPAKHPHVHAEEATRYVTWLTSAEGQALIGGFTVKGRQLFVPSAATATGSGAP